MTQSGRKLENHRLILALTGTLFLVTGSRTAQATGCHVPERPVLARALSWERWQQAGYSPADPLLAPAPPAILPVPCQGETATLQWFASGLVSADLRRAGSSRSQPRGNTWPSSRRHSFHPPSLPALIGRPAAGPPLDRPWSDLEHRGVG